MVSMYTVDHTQHSLVVKYYELPSNACAERAFRIVLVASIGLYDMKHSEHSVLIIFFSFSPRNPLIRALPFVHKPRMTVFSIVFPQI